MEKDNVEKQKITAERDDEMSALHKLKNVEKVWKHATENTKYNENGQATISEKERESEKDWE